MQDITQFIAQHQALSIAALIIFILLVFIELIRAKRKSNTVTPTQATQLINHQDAQIIDIRNADQYAKGHIIGAQLFPPAELTTVNKKLEKLKSKPLIIVCSTGTESQKIAAQLVKQGYNAYSLAGGLRAWSDAQMPLVKE